MKPEIRQTDLDAQSTIPGTDAQCRTPWRWMLAGISAFALSLPGSANAVPDAATVNNASVLLTDSLQALYTNSSSADTQFWVNGFWVYPNSLAGWSSGAGPSSAAAELFLWRQKHNYTLPGADATTNAWLRSTSTASINTLLTHINPDGLFESKALPDTQTSLIEICASFLALRDTLDPNTRKNWLNAMMRMTNYLIVDGDLPDPIQTDWHGTSGWYTNGNYELMESELLYQMYLATGDTRYKNLFDTQWTSTLHPDTGMWPHFGLVVTRNPNPPSDPYGAAYLIEASSPTVYGYDGDYAQYQETIAARLYLMLPDAPRLQLANQLVNQLWPYVNHNTWILDASNGSRHNNPTIGFSTPGVDVLAWLGGRTDLVSDVAGQFAQQINGNYLGNAFQNWGSPGILHGYGNSVAALLQADLTGTSLPVAPGTPTAVASNGQITLTWPMSIGAVSYNVKRATASDGPYATIASSPPAIYTDTAATNGVNFYYVVSAVNRVGESANSAPVLATASPIAPAAPANLAVTGGSGRAMLVWLKSTGATSYKLKRATVSGGTYTTIASPADPANVSPYIDSGLNNGTTYYYVASAVNAYGESANSPETSVTPQFLYAPRIYSATGANNQVTLNWWTVRGTEFYNVKRATTAGGPYVSIKSNLQATTYTDTGLNNGTNYYYMVTGVVSGTEGLNSPSISSVPTAVPIPTNVQAKASPSVTYPAAITASWGASVVSTNPTKIQADSYNVRRSTGGAYALLANVPGSSTSASFSYVDTTTAAGTTYYYIISAVYGGAEGLNSSSASGASASTSLPGTPTGLSGSDSGAQVTLSWTGAAGATSYNVKRCTYNGGPYLTISSGSAATSFTDTRVTHGTIYYYAVSAVNASGEGTNSNQYTAASNPLTPAGLTATAGQVALGWQASNGAGLYKLSRSTALNGTYTQISSSNLLTATDSGLTSGTTYYYKVRATNASGDGPDSAAVSVVPN